MPVPNTFASATSAIPLANLDTNFATPITLGNTAVQLGNTITTINSVTLVNATISSTNGDANIHGLTVGLGGGSGAGNTALGYNALSANSTGTNNTATGYQALGGATVTGTNNSAYGQQALYSNTSGGSNIAYGNYALYSNTTASNNTAVGYQAGYSNQTGAYNLYLGYQAGYAATGSYNTFVGSGNGTTGSTGGQITSGSKNTILGGYNGNQGGLDIRTSSNYIVLSDGDGNPRGIFDNSGNLGLGVTPASWSGRTAFQVGTAGQMNYGAGISNGGSMAYGNNGYWNGSADKAISNGYSQIVALNDNGTGRVIILTTSGTSSAGASISYTAGPYVSAGGTSWTNSSDERLKNITGLIANGLESVNTLRAARYTWKDDSTNKPKVGLIAQDVQKVLPEVIETFTKYNSEDTTEYLGVTYTEVIPLLVAAIQELSAKVTALEAKVA